MIYYCWHVLQGKNKTHILGVILYSSCLSYGLLLFAAAAAKSLQSCLTLCDPIDGNPPGSPISGILKLFFCYPKKSTKSQRKHVTLRLKYVLNLLFKHLISLTLHKYIRSKYFKDNSNMYIQMSINDICDRLFIFDHVTTV